jgi:hypothetical protein
MLLILKLGIWIFSSEFFIVCFAKTEIMKQVLEFGEKRKLNFF